MSQQHEIWKPIPGWPDYQVSSIGRVASHRSGSARLLRPSPTHDGYLRVRIFRDGAWKNRGIHQLVALAFHGPQPDGTEVRHLDGDGSNNLPSNLRWGTHSENTYDKVRHGRHLMANRTECKNGHPFDEKNTRYSAVGHRTCRACCRIRFHQYKTRQMLAAANVRQASAA